MHKLKPCPHCGAMLSAALADAITDPLRDESCPRRAKREIRIDARLTDAAMTRPSERLVLGEDELVARRLVAYALLGSIATARAEREQHLAHIGTGS